MTEAMLTDADLLMTGQQYTVTVTDSDAANSTTSFQWKNVLEGMEQADLPDKSAVVMWQDPDPQDGMESAGEDDESDTVILKPIQSAVVYEAPPEESKGLRRVLERLSPGDKATGFKVKGNHFLITFSNNFKDRDKEVFTEKAINAYVNRVDMGMTPPPEVWVWHAGKSVRIGQSAMVGYHDHFLIAVGEFDTTKQAQNAKAYYAKHQRQTGVSHGFVYPTGSFDGQHYHEFNTYEISLLPKTVAANPFTNLEQVKESKMALDDKKRQYIKDVFGDEADRVLETLTESGKALEEMQHAYKDFTDPKPVSSDTVNQLAVKAANEDIKSLIPDLLEGQAEVFRINSAIMERMKAYESQNTELRQQVKEAVDGLRAIKSDLPRMASTDTDTIVRDEALRAKMKNSMETIDPAARALFGNLVGE